MEHNKTYKKIILGVILITTCLSAQSQKRPEVMLGLRYNSDVLFRTTHDNHPLAIKIGGGLNFNEKWYTGINADYFGTKSSSTDAKHYLIELELRRSFEFKPISKIDLNLSFRPGYILIDAYSYTIVTQLDLYKTITISLSTGISYSISDHFKFTICPGLTWLPQESSGYFNTQRIGTYCEGGFSYKF